MSGNERQVDRGFLSVSEDTASVPVFTADALKNLINRQQVIDAPGNQTVGLSRASRVLK